MNNEQSPPNGSNGSVFDRTQNSILCQHVEKLSQQLWDDMVNNTPSSSHHQLYCASVTVEEADNESDKRNN